MFILSRQRDSGLKHKVVRFATCWQITRSDSTILRLTDHSEQLYIGASYYKPAGGANASAIASEAGMKPQNLDIVGIIDSNEITTDDLRAGLYRGAEVIQYLVDWMYPWSGYFETNYYTIGSVTFSGNVYTAELLGPTHQLEKLTGRVASKRCDYVLGQHPCGVNMASFNWDAQEVLTVQYPRHTFRSDPDVGSPHPSGVSHMWIGAVIDWDSGNNSGLSSVVAEYTTGTREFTLYEPLPYDIEIGDEFTIYNTCNHDATACSSSIKAYYQMKEYGGLPDMPGLNETIKGPDIGT